MLAQRVYCPVCDQYIPAVDINIARMTGLCSSCDHIFPITPPLQQPALAESEPSRPSGITVERNARGEILLIRTWFQNMFIFLLFFCLAWDGFLIFWYTMAVTDPAEGGMRFMTLFFPICHVAVGIGLTYFTIAGFFNRSEIMVGPQGLSIRHRPIPWRGNRDLDRNDIQGIEVDFSAVQDSEESSPQQMIVSVHHSDGRQITLLNHIPVRHADFIAWHLANSLDVPLKYLRGGQQNP